ncbi:MAG: Holliday junction resolvase-like protein [Candidatus Hadarchaeum sp.]|uniref:Holliday junction resolvase-like protein n=1 Tax=Candidatus Hadarchaeum sp. TaxID=2883567 RepID=UPI003D1379BF
MGKALGGSKPWFIEGGEQIIEVIIFILGLLLGIALAFIYLRGQLAIRFERWKSEFEERIRQEVLERSRAVLKGKIAEQLAPLLPMFKYEPADARFLGSPVDYVVFEGYKEGEPKGVVFVDIKTGKSADLTPLQRKLKQVIEQGRVHWETIHLGGLESE